MPDTLVPTAAALSSIIDNLGNNTLLRALERRTPQGRELCIATAFFSLDALNLIGEHLMGYDRVRLLFGDDASATQRSLQLQKLRQVSDEDLLRQRERDPLLGGLRHAAGVLESGRFEARCYTREKFHAKAYLVHRDGYPDLAGVIGSGNFTRPGLTQNIELNVDLTVDQSVQLRDWFDARWEEAQADVVTEEILNEVNRQVNLYEPHLLYLRALLEWGDWIQGREPLPPGRMLPILDPHQLEGFRRSLKVLARDSGVLVCDGVGLGKSFIALALMEHFVNRGKRVLLIAPKAILESAWIGYLDRYLFEELEEFASLQHRAVTDFGKFPARGDAEAEDAYRQKEQAKGERGAVRVADREKFLKNLVRLSEKAEVVVIDESHNLRTPSSQRYLNTIELLKTRLLGKKQVILLTATPLNTKHTDLTAQFGLAAGLEGTIGTRPVEQLRVLAGKLDTEMRRDPERQLGLQEEIPDHRPLLEALKRIAIQRSRAECKRIAFQAGKPLRFPKRNPPRVVDYELSPAYEDMVQEVEREFLKLAKFLGDWRQEVKRAAAAGEKQIKKSKVRLPNQGLRLSAYLPNRYRLEEANSLREAQVESFLVSLVFTNVMKQLESSPVAFQSILQSLGAGLCARLLKAFPNDPEAAVIADRHRGWINVKVRTYGEESVYEDDPEAEDVPIVGDETESDEEGPYLWPETQADRVSAALRSASVRKALVDFGPETHDVKTWRRHLESDLDVLERIADYVRAARQSGEDLKLRRIAEVLKEQKAKGRKVLVFTQSVRTAEYLEDNLPRILGKTRIRRIDANVQGDRRQALLHAFSPRYNAPPRSQETLPGMDELDILVSTDVLSEGVNLQEAGCILNYDIHWNPVRLIQRIGRVDRRLREDDPEHEFDIVNVFPPKELERILNLVGTVEGRVAAISRLLGIDQSFFKSSDPEGTLKEFDGMVDGDTDPDDDLLLSYNELTAEQIARAREVPNGAFGVWKGSGHSGAAALFTLELRDDAPESDRIAFERQVGTPLFVMKTGQGYLRDPVKILTTLAGTVPGVPSGEPSLSPDKLGKLLRDLREEAEESLPSSTPQSVVLRLVLWLELRP